MTGSAGRARRDAVSEQRRAPLARRLRLVVEVDVVMPEGLPVAIDEARPRADARDVVAPGSRRRHLRRIREPERAGVRDPEAVAPNRIAAYSPRLRPSSRPTPTTLAGHAARISSIWRQRLLQPHEIGVGLAHHVEQELAADCPVIVAVVRGAVSNVERHDLSGSRGIGCAPASPPASSTTTTARIASIFGRCRCCRAWLPIIRAPP